MRSEATNVFNHLVLNIGGAGGSINIDSVSVGQTNSALVAAQQIRLRPPEVVASALSLRERAREARVRAGMLKELEAHPESGFLGHSGLGRTIVQYWRSFEHLEAYARAKDKKHWPAWVDFNRRVGGSRSDVVIWHETYIIKPGHYEAVYSGMPPYGLGKVGKLVSATGAREAARSRMTASTNSCIIMTLLLWRSASA